MKNIEAFYPLSPLQQGMLFETLMSPESRVYFEQLTYSLVGKLDISAFEPAWQQVMNRHASLRTTFSWEGLKEPVQVVHRRAKLPFAKLDWRDLSPAAQLERLDEYLQEDRQQGFDLTRAPLMRTSLIRMAEEEYQFVWSHHHLLFDGWSMPIILRDLAAYYAAACEGRELQLQPSRPYRDYVVWLRQQDMSMAGAFWQEALKGFKRPTPLGVDRANGDRGGSGGEPGEQEVQFSVSLTTALQSLARQSQLTLNTIVHGAWGALLSRYSGEEDVVFGVTVSGRPAELTDIESMVGLFINTLPARVVASPDEDALTWLKNIQTQQAKSRQYEHTSLVDVRRWSEVEYGLPLFESILAYKNYPLGSFKEKQRGGFEVRGVRAYERTNYPLTILAGLGDRLTLRIIYDNRRFDSGAIGRMLGHFETIFDALARNPRQSLASLPLLSKAERVYLTSELNDTRRPYPLDLSVHQFFHTQAAIAPDAIALVFENQSLTYGELERRTNQLAQYLFALGLASETMVGVALYRSLEMVIAQLAILKAGAAFMPLDPHYPLNRLASMIEDAQVPLLLTTAAIRDELPPLRCYVICLDADEHLINQRLNRYCAAPTLPDHLAYVIYTSGSTGRPKGVQITHRALLNLCAWHQERFAVTSADRATQLASPAFDAAVWETFPYLLCGASLHLVPEADRSHPERLLQWLRQEQITISFAPTPVAERLLELEWNDGAALRVLLTGGDRLSAGARKGLEFKVVNNYGPTETTVVATSGEVAEKCGEAVPTIGRGIGNVETYAVDSRGHAVSIGMAGELWVGGEGVGRGYVNDPWQTAERFVPDGMSGRAGGRLYRTGDVVRYCANGELEYLGRVDHQVKVRGYRIELGEVEAALRRVEGVREAVAEVSEGSGGEKSLVGYVVWKEGQERNWEEVRRRLSERLPEYMVPGAWVELAELPLNGNGKVDRQKLREAYGERAVMGAEYVGPRTPEEEALVEIWEKILGADRVGVHDNFFALGGHSLLAIQVVNRVWETFHVKLSIRDVIESPTVAELMKAIAQALIEEVDAPERARLLAALEYEERT